MANLVCWGLSIARLIGVVVILRCEAVVVQYVIWYKHVCININLMALWPFAQNFFPLEILKAQSML